MQRYRELTEAGGRMGVNGFVLFIGAVFAAVPAAGAARAQEPARAPADTAEILPLPPIQVRVVLAEDIEFTPGAASILSGVQIHDFRPYTLHDAFDVIPGIRTIEDDVLGRRSGIGIRGAPPRRSRKTLLLEDGSPVNASTYLDPSGHYTPPMERIERVEILKGAGQLIHGPLNNHGVINFRNRGPTPSPQTTVELGGGTLSSFKRHVLHSRTAGPVGVVLSYTGMNADGAFDVEAHQYDDFYGSVDWRPGDRQRVAASFTYFRERSDGYDEANLTPEQFALHPRSKRVLDEGREYNNIAVDYLKADLSHDARFSDRAGVSTKLFATRLDRPRFQTRGTAPSLGGVMEGRDRRYRTLGIESRFEIALLRALGIEHTLQGGVRFERQHFDDRRPVGRPGEALNAGNPGNVFAVAGLDGYTNDGRLISYDGDAASIFVQDAIRAGAWVITPGLRLETYRQARRTVFRPGSAEEGVRETGRNTLVLPGIGILYHGFWTTQLYAGLHRGFAPASARTEEFPLIPETGVNAQIGVRSSAIPGITFDVATFYNRISNTLIRDAVDVFGDALFINAANSRVYGVDVSSRIDASGYRPAARNAFAEVAYNFTRSEFVAGPLDGNRVPEVPQHVGSMTLGLERAENWLVSGTVSHFGYFYADKENTRELRTDGGRVPGRILFSARASYTFSGRPGTTIWVQGRNLADRLYVTDVQDGLRPGAARTVMAGIAIRF